MKKSVLVKVGDRFEHQIVDMTQDEIAEFERQQEEAPEPEPTPEERISELEAAMEVLLSGRTE